MRRNICCRAASAHSASLYQANVSPDCDEETVTAVLDKPLLDLAGVDPHVPAAACPLPSHQQWSCHLLHLNSLHLHHGRLRGFPQIALDCLVLSKLKVLAVEDILSVLTPPSRFNFVIG